MPDLRARVVTGLDRISGVDTGTPVSSAELGYERDELRGYQASHRLALRAALPKSSVSPQDVLLDLGSGKGLVVLQAARHYRFRRVIGIERSPLLASIAGANLEHARPRLRCGVELINADAASETVPADVTTVYAFNPFQGLVFDCVVDRLVELVERRRSGLRILYVNPVEHERLIARRGIVEQPPPPAWRLRLAGLPPHFVRRYELRPVAA